MPGLANPTPPATEVGPDEEIRDLLREIVLVLRVIEAHLQAASDEEFTEEDVAP